MGECFSKGMFGSGKVHALIASGLALLHSPFNQELKGRENKHLHSADAPMLTCTTLAIALLPLTRVVPHVLAQQGASADPSLHHLSASNNHCGLVTGATSTPSRPLPQTTSCTTPRLLSATAPRRQSTKVRGAKSILLCEVRAPEPASSAAAAGKPKPDLAGRGSHIHTPV